MSKIDPKNTKRVQIDRFFSELGEVDFFLYFFVFVPVRAAPSHICVRGRIVAIATAGEHSGPIQLVNTTTACVLRS